MEGFELQVCKHCGAVLNPDIDPMETGLCLDCYDLWCNHSDMEDMK